MRSRYFIQHIAIALFLIVFLVAANNSIGSSEEEQSVSKLIQLIAKLTARIEALEERIQVLEVQIKALEAEKGRSDEWHQVLRVIDGDTILISSGETLRYIGINTPETVDPRKPVEPFGKEAAEFNKKLVEKQKVRLEFDVQERDKYGRLLAYVYLEDGTLVNAELVKHGYARVATYPPNVKYQALFLKLEREARENKRGLWGEEPAPEELLPNEDSDIVYITKTGTKYHREGCRYLSKSAIPIKKREAIARGYTPCLRCEP